MAAITSYVIYRLQSKTPMATIDGSGVNDCDLGCGNPECCGSAHCDDCHPWIVEECDTYERVIVLSSEHDEEEE